MKRYSVILFCLVVILRFSGKAQVADTTLKGYAPFRFGAAISANLLETNSRYRALVAKEYSSITPENAMKFGVIHPAQDSFYWTDADTIVAFAQKYGKRIHGHNLVWYQNLPSWVTNFVGDSAAWESVMKTHIQTVVSRYKGKVTSWDVVNEAISDSAGLMRNSVWLQHLGPNYIARAFQYAHAADTAALLFYNDYNQESSNYTYAKLYAIQNLVNGLVASGIPINGVGMQMHINKNTNNNNIQRAIDSMYNTGLLVHISELDVAVNPEDNPALTFNTTVASQQFGKFKFMSRAARNIPANQFYGITTWDVTDADSWIPTAYNRPDFPLPFNGSYQQKSSFYGFKDGLTQSWSAAAASGQSLAGTYTDLGTNGTAITTNFAGTAMTYDDDNSSVQNIGFNFVFNGSTYTQFVLNTNGYIKLGASAPSSATVFYPTSFASYGSTTTASDIDLIYPYNHDLQAGSGTPEYRVYTSGAVGSRVCTIQFKNVADKVTPTQFTNINFQIKLYESTNVIDFVYGNWTASGNAATSVTSAVGIKGATVNESVNVAKGSGTAWTTALKAANNFFFRDGDYPTAGPEFNTKNTFLPDVGRTFRFATSTSTLPLSLLGFEAKATGNNVVLQWETANEINCKDFEVQRSLDGTGFSTIAIMNAKGDNASFNNQYSSTDNGISSLKVAYYRLKEDAADGSYTYSGVIKVNLQGNISFRVVTAPNPFTNQINVRIQSATAQDMHISLLDLNGRTLFTKQQTVSEGTCSMAFDASSITRGIYFLRVNTSTAETMMKLIK